MFSKSGNKSFGGGKKGKKGKEKSFKGSNSRFGYKSGKSSAMAYKFSPLDTRYGAPQATYVTVLEKLENEILKDFDKMAKHVANSLVDCQKDEPVRPTMQRSDNEDATKKQLEDEEYAILYKEQIKKYNYKLDDLEDGLTRAHGLIWGDYMTLSMQDRIEQHPRVCIQDQRGSY
jgi:hypothetical protein